MRTRRDCINPRPKRNPHKFDAVSKPIQLITIIHFEMA
jgi:hypothetical protein